MKYEKIQLKDISSEDDIRFLFRLLLERPKHINISHKSMPTYTQHKDFVNSNPYDVWFIIHKYNKRVGTVYKTKLGEVGIFVKKEFQRQGIGSDAVKELFEFGDRTIANISPTNFESISFFKRLGFKHIQNTYER